MRNTASKLCLSLVFLVSPTTLSCAGPEEEQAEKNNNSVPSQSQDVANKVETEKKSEVAKPKEIKIAANETKENSGQTAKLPDGVYQEDGKYFDKDDVPIYFNNKEKGTWDWLTFNGNRRYHAECHVCHGPLGLGSSFAPGLKDSLTRLSYDDFREVVVNGREVQVPGGGVSKMPAFGTNKNVMCFLDDIYVYLRARADNKMGAIFHRDIKKERKSKEIREEEEDCFAG